MVPVYNQEVYAIDAIESVLRQSYNNKEIIVVDDCSTDNTFEILEKKFSHHPKVRVYRNESNLGRVGNYKNILENYTNGEYVLNVDGDDMLLDPLFLEKSISLIETYDNIVLCQSSHARLKAPPENIRFDNHNYIVLNGQDYVYNYYGTFNFNHVTSLYKAELAKKIDFYRCNVLASDAESILRLSMHGNIVMREEYGGFWRDHGENESSSTDWIKQYSDAKQYTSSLYKYLQKHFPKNYKKNRKVKNKILIQSTLPLLAKSLKNLQLVSFGKVLYRFIISSPYFLFDKYFYWYILFKAGLLEFKY
jgi:glycosyltransferase involved in cell wall biosynthesis